MKQIKPKSVTILQEFAKQCCEEHRYLPFKSNLGTSLGVQWLRIHLPMRGKRVRALVREDPTCRGATTAVRHNY
ncbi:hypothetical protein J1605_019092 [Eschrichtius robustus]|uniref:Uncharacterized protein n=1 Tax=Eschrichtius robustus TaxID=9764 RepID=A0AB34HT32_ESCRO|nr:hypothetical protein J1605_019092 [Eschrichtius robustus]